jgi:hypothetical protein
MVGVLQMIKNSRSLQVILAVDMVALLLYNVAGMMVTGQLGAVFRTVLETTRTLFVWLVSETPASMQTPAQHARIRLPLACSTELFPNSFRAGFKADWLARALQHLDSLPSL